MGHLDEPSEPKALALGLTQQWVKPPQIVIFKLTNMLDKTVDVWIDACLSVMQECNLAKRPLLVLQDLSHPHVHQTTYSRVRGNGVALAYPDLPGRVAFVLAENYAAQRARRFVEAQTKETRERAICVVFEEALAWLKAYQPTPPPTEEDLG
jgi:hypothetical protein